jgi:exosortase A
MPLNGINSNIKILIALLPLLFIAFFQEWTDYFELWANSYIYRHGLLVFASVLYLCYLRRERFQRLEISFSRLGLAALIALCLLLVLAHAGNIKLIRMVLLPFLLIAWGGTIWGKPFLQTAGAPLLLVLFAAPFWDELSPLLQWLTVAVDEGALAVLSIPATIEEFYITIPSGIFHVADGCSGIRYLMVGLYLGAFYGTLTNSRPRRTLLMILVAGFLALLTNWIRVAWIIAAGHYTNMESSLVEDHEMFGWIVFVVVTLIPFLFFTHYLDRHPSMNPAPAESSTKSPRKSKKQTRTITMACLPLAAIPLVLMAQSYSAANEADQWNPSLPSVAESQWKGPLQYAEFWQPQFKTADIHLSGVYVSDALARVQIDLIGYKQQHQGKELVYYQNRVFEPDKWHPIAKQEVAISVGNDWNINKVNQIIFQSKRSDQLAVSWYWYDIGGVSGTSATEVQLIGGLKKLIGDTRGSAWILSTLCNSTEAASCASAAQDTIESLLSDLSLSG